MIFEEEEIVMAKAKSRSTSLPEDLDLRVRTIALRENRTPANVLENAVRVFTLLPQDLRNLLIENSADQMKGARKIEELSRRIMFSLARERFDRPLRSLPLPMERSTTTCLTPTRWSWSRRMVLWQPDHDRRGPGHQRTRLKIVCR